MSGPSPQDLMVAAMNAEEYDNAAYCGAYVHGVTGPKGEVTVRIVDLCPECRAGHLDLSQEAFAAYCRPAPGAGGDHLAAGQPGDIRADRLSLQGWQQPVVDGGAGSQPPQSHRQTGISGRGAASAVGRSAVNLVQLLRADEPGHGAGAVYLPGDGLVWQCAGG